MKVFVFVQENCPTCSKLKEQLNNLENKNMSLVSYFYPFNNKAVYDKYSILSTPVTVVVNEEELEIDRFYGAKDTAFIEKFINDNKEVK